MKAVVVLSGGQDSTTCLFHAIQRGYEVHAITFNYGQRHSREVQAAAQVALLAGVKTHEIVRLPAHVLRGTSPLVSDAQLEQYTGHDALPGGLEKTFVPMRNQLFLTIAANRAYTHGTNVVITGVSQEDFGGYPDCTREFIDLFEAVSSRGTFTGDRETLPFLSVQTPLIHLDKEATVRMALELEGCYAALAYSHTSYAGEYPPTSKDHASLLRAKGFEKAGVPDPLVLRAYLEGALTALPETANYQNHGLGYYLDTVRRVMERMEELHDEKGGLYRFVVYT